MLGQALSAASRTVSEERFAHSMHGYFLRSGDNNKPVVFYVEVLRDGGSFSTRNVVAKQGGKAIFNASVSFKVSEPEHPEQRSHQPVAPKVPSPSSLQSDWERRKAKGFPDTYADLDPFSVFDFRTVGPLFDEVKEGDSDAHGYWVKATESALESVLMQQCLIAYLSDIRMLAGALMPHGLKPMDEGIHCTSLDHSIWFHQPFQFDDWLYHDLVGPVSADARGLNFGRFYDVNGQLIASCVSVNNQGNAC